MMTGLTTRAIAARTASPSSRVCTPKIHCAPAPGSGGWIGAAPVAIISWWKPSHFSPSVTSVPMKYGIPQAE